MIRRHLFGLKESFRGGLDRVCGQKARAGYFITKWMMEYTKIGGASASPNHLVVYGLAGGLKFPLAHWPLRD